MCTVFSVFTRNPKDGHKTDGASEDQNTPSKMPKWWEEYNSWGSADSIFTKPLENSAKRGTGGV